MGGRGSGRRSSYCGKPETNDSMPLDIRKLARAGVLMPGLSFSWQWLVNDRKVAGISIRVDWHHSLVLAYRVKSTGELVEQRVHTQTSACHLGGERRWFTCPRCNKRVAVLYAPGKYFACRNCYGLGYTTQKEGAGDRAASRAEKLRKRLGWEAGILNGNGGRPKGMHLTTYEQLERRHDELVQVSLHDIALKFGFLHKVLSS
ncbi:hypothetical protein [Hydrogenophaga atypica]|uniref:Transposase zinc-ribbon domain-containing protein n=1 Tax=Hydrogenophaga atypica TaxID=249409 RepID=A0ABW2QS55_9BURK